MIKVKTRIDNIFKPLYTSKKRYFFSTGGRGSTKTFSIHDFICKLTYEKGHGVLFTRYTMTSAEKSIIPEFKMTLDRLGVANDFHITKTTAVNKKTGSFIFFSGIKTSQGDQTGNLKSLPNITTWVIEEGEDFNDEKAFDTIDDSIRQKGKDNRIIWIMNPTTREHFIYKRWVENWEKQIDLDGFKVKIGDHPEVENMHSSYLIATNYLSHSFLKKAWKWRTRAKTGYCPIEKKTLSEEEHQKAIDWYTNNYLGGWKDKADGVIYPDWEIGAFDETLIHKCYGMDFGSRDPDALVKIAIDHKAMKIYLHEEYYKNNTKAAVLMKVLHDRVGFTQLIVADTNERRLRLDLRDGMSGIDGVWLRGVNIVGAKKGGGSVIRTIKKIQSYILIVTPESVNIKKSLNNYVWHDKKAEVPNHEWSHIPNAFGYGAMELLDR